MANANEVWSRENSALLEGTDGVDNISVYGNYQKVKALGSSDTIQIYSGRKNDLVYAGDGNDLIKDYSDGSTLYGEAGNDTVKFYGKNTFADGGADDDFFQVYSSEYYQADNITITGGAGNDTIELSPYYKTMNVVVTDFSNEDVLFFDSAYEDKGRKLSFESENGQIIITDNGSVKSYDDNGNPGLSTLQPHFNLTLEGISDISEVADAKYYRRFNKNPFKSGTLGELLGVDAGTVEPATNTETVSTSTETVATTNTKTTTTTEETTSKITTTKIEDTATTSTPTVTVGGGDIIINNYNYYGDYTDNSNNNGTIINQSSIGGDVKNSTTVDNSKTLVISGNTYTYNGGDKVINNYQQGEVVELASDYQGIDLSGNSFFVKSSSGQLEIQNSRDKFVGYSAESEVVAYSYVASGGGNVDGRDKNVAEIMIGGDNANNQIYAGSGGSSLWGGNGGIDTLTGGDGNDEFFYAVGSGNDVVQNADSNDLINLASITLSQISGVEVNIGQININFIDGGSLKVQGGDDVRYQIAEGTFAVNQTTKEWSAK